MSAGIAILTEKGGLQIVWRRKVEGSFDQFFEESERIIPGVTDRLSAGDIAGIGPLVDRSQHLADHLLGNQIPETIALARAARGLGALASSAFGAGFGGSVWALVPDRDHRTFLDRWDAAYRHDFPAAAARAQFFVTRPGPAAVRLHNVHRASL